MEHAIGRGHHHWSDITRHERTHVPIPPEHRQGPRDVQRQSRIRRQLAPLQLFHQRDPVPRGEPVRLDRGHRQSDAARCRYSPRTV